MSLKVIPLRRLEDFLEWPVTEPLEDRSIDIDYLIPRKDIADYSIKKDLFKEVYVKIKRTKKHVFLYRVTDQKRLEAVTKDWTDNQALSKENPQMKERRLANMADEYLLKAGMTLENKIDITFGEMLKVLTTLDTLKQLFGASRQFNTQKKDFHAYMRKKYGAVDVKSQEFLDGKVPGDVVTYFDPLYKAYLKAVKSDEETKR